MGILILITVMIAALAAYVTRNKFKDKFIPHARLRNSDLVAVILGLNQEDLDKVFDLYRAQFGPEAARYARRTYIKWRSGQVRPRKQTFNRLLVYLPKVMSFDLKCELLRKLREEYCSKSNYKLTVDTENWKDALAPLFASVIKSAYTAQLPKEIEERLTWLSDNDTQTARAILAESQAQESRNALSLLDQEFSNIERLLSNNGESKITHTIKLPYAIIKLKIKKR